MMIFSCIYVNIIILCRPCIFSLASPPTSSLLLFLNNNKKQQEQITKTFLNEKSACRDGTPPPPQKKKTTTTTTTKLDGNDTTTLHTLPTSCAIQVANYAQHKTLHARSLFICAKCSIAHSTVFYRYISTMFSSSGGSKGGEHRAHSPPSSRQTQFSWAAGWL